jgi:hypothetical protein
VTRLKPTSCLPFGKIQTLIGDQDHWWMNCHINLVGMWGGATTPRTIQSDDVGHRLCTGSFEAITTGDVHARPRVINQLCGLDGPRALAEPLLTRP